MKRMVNASRFKIYKTTFKKSTMSSTARTSSGMLAAVSSKPPWPGPSPNDTQTPNSQNGDTSPVQFVWISACPWKLARKCAVWKISLGATHRDSRGRFETENMNMKCDVLIPLTGHLLGLVDTRTDMGSPSTKLPTSFSESQKTRGTTSNV